MKNWPSTSPDLWFDRIERGRKKPREFAFAVSYLRAKMTIIFFTRQRSGLKVNQRPHKHIASFQIFTVCQSNQFNLINWVLPNKKIQTRGNERCIFSCIYWINQRLWRVRYFICKPTDAFLNELSGFSTIKQTSAVYLAIPKKGQEVTGLVRYFSCFTLVLK